MTFAAVGSLIQATSSTFTLVPGGVGDLILIEVQNQTNAAVSATALSSSNVTWAQMGTTVTGVNFSGTAVIFAGTVTSVSSATVTVTWSGTAPAAIGIDGQEFSSTAGSWALDVQGSIDSAGGTSTFASLTPAAAGELYFGYAIPPFVAAVAGSTPGYTYDVDAATNGMCFNPACTSAAQAPVWGNSGMVFGKMVLVKETGGAAPSGRAQPKATIQVPRRRPGRGLWQRITGQAFVKVPAPAWQPRPAPRRKPARAVVRFTPVRTTNAAPAPPVTGTVQPRATVPVPRRRPGRAVALFRPVTTVNAVPPLPPGTVQPRATIPVPRRGPARAVARGLAVPGIYPAPPAQQYRTAPRRALARAVWRGITGQAFVKVPAPRQQYRTPPRRTRSRAYVRFTPVRTANAFIPRTLLIALASKAGIDDYGNTYPQGIFASAGVIEGPEVIAGTAPLTQVVLTDNGAGAGEVQFQPNDSRFLFGAINSEVIGSPNYDSMGIIGPASTAPGHGDFVEEAFNSANAAGTSTANWQIFYIDPSGGGHLVAVVDANGFTVSGNLIVDGTASLNDGATVTNGLTTDTLNVTGGTIDLAGGAASLTENNFNMASPMGTLPGYPLPTDGNTGSSWATGERAFINNCVNAINALVAELQNRGMMS